jgi:hypothetical protein
MQFIPGASRRSRVSEGGRLDKNAAVIVLAWGRRCVSKSPTVGC